MLSVAHSVSAAMVKVGLDVAMVRILPQPARYRLSCSDRIMRASCYPGRSECCRSPTASARPWSKLGWTWRWSAYCRSLPGTGCRVQIGSCAPPAIQVALNVVGRPQRQRGHGQSWVGRGDGPHIAAACQVQVVVFRSDHALLLLSRSL